MSFEYIDSETGLGVELKQPNESVTVIVDFSALLHDTPLTTINTVTSVNLGRVVGSSNLSLSNQAILDGYAVTVLVSGGTANEAYRLTVRATDSGGDTHELDGCIYAIEA